MTFNNNAKIDVGKASKLSGKRGVMLGGGGGMLGLVILFLASQFFGVDLTGLMGDTSTSSTTASSETQDLSHCTTGEAANTYVECRMVGAFDSIDTYWSGQLDGYRSPGLRMFTSQVSTGCGTATSAVGPFYCPSDENIYLDTDFFDTLQTQLGAQGGSLAQMYVVAHEAGHHISNLTGVMDQADRTGTGPDSDSVKLELQADCYAGAWVGSASTVTDTNGVPFLQEPTKAEIADALDAAAAVGDDRIQARSGSVNSETWTHGSAKQRQSWFTKGMTGGPSACDTFA